MATAKEIEKMLKEYANSSEGKRRLKSELKLDHSDMVAINADTKKAIRLLEELICNYAPPSIAHSISLEEISNSIGVSAANNGSYVIDLDFRKSLLQRASFSNDRVYDIAGLFTKGWDTSTDEPRVWGRWHSTKYFNKLHRDPDDFIRRAVDAFMATYAQEFGIIECIIDPRYLPD